MASSSARMEASCSRALAKQSSCRCPTEKLSPPSLMAIPRPPAAPLTCSESCTRRSTSQTAASACLSKGSRLPRREPLKSTGSCGMIASCRRRVSTPMCEMSTPPIVMRPAMVSIMRKSVSMRLLLPLQSSTHQQTSYQFGSFSKREEGRG